MVVAVVVVWQGLWCEQGLAGLSLWLVVLPVAAVFSASLEYHTLEHSHKTVVVVVVVVVVMRTVVAVVVVKEAMVMKMMMMTMMMTKQHKELNLNLLVFVSGETLCGSWGAVGGTDPLSGG